LSLLSPTENIYAIKFYTNPSASYTYKEARVEFSNLLSVSLLSQFRLYNIYYSRPCPTVYANRLTGFGSGLLAYVDSAANVADANPNNRARMVALLDLLGISSTYIEVGFPIMGKPGDYVGFTATNSSALLSLSVLSGLTITTYDQTGAVRETKSGSSLLNLKLLGGSSGRYSIGFQTQAGSYRISKIRLTKTAAVGLLEDLYVYNGYYYTVNRPPVTVTTSGPITFCEGGSVTLTAFDSLGYTNYVWNNGTTGNKLTVSASGTYYVQVEDSVACTRRSIPMEVIVNPNPTPRIVGDSVLCLTSAGSLSLAGTSYTSRTWSTGAATPTITGLNPGRYYVNVTDSNTCKGTDTITVAYNDLMVTPTITPTSCSNTATGAISLAVTKGSGNYSYRWSNGANTASITGLREGLYTCIVTDNVYGCTFNKSFSITATNRMTVSASTVNTSACGKSDAKITLSVAGASGTYNYLWSNGATAATNDNISAGIYTVKITDAGSGCAMSDTFGVSDGASALVVAPAITPSTNCAAPNGAIAISVSGGSGTYTYKWSHSSSTAASVSGLQPGTYYVAVTDAADNCTTTLAVIVPNMGVLNLVSTIAQPGCKMANGAINITSVTGGSGTNTYNWSTGANTAGITGVPSGTYIVTVNNAGSGCTHTEVYTLTDAGGPSVTLSVTGPDCNNANGAISASATATSKYLWSTGATTKNVSGLKPGMYTVTVTDSVSNCMSVQSTYVAPKIPIRLAATPMANTSCPSSPNGSINIALTGGTAPYTYNWSSGDATKDLSGKNAGTYNLNVTDGNGCTASISVVLRTDSAKVLLATVSSIVASSCSEAKNGKAYVTVTGGTTPYAYSWTPGGATTKDLENVKAGTYTLSITDDAGCTITVDAVIPASTSNPLIVKLDSVINVGCLDTLAGKAYLSTSGGTKPYTFSWNSGAASEDLINVRAGNYTLTVTDSNGCIATVKVDIIKLSNFTVMQNVKNISCHGDNNGSINLTASGGTGAYTFKWLDGTDGRNRTGLNGGAYTVTVTDTASKCSKTLDITIVEPDALSLTGTVKNDTCTTGPDGSVVLEVKGGTMPYSYQWSNGTNTPSLFNLAADKYSVTVTDANMCQIMGEYTVMQSSCDFTINIHNVLTPNGDGDNDYFMIEGIQFYPNNQVQILDKWGDVVYEKRNYDNSWNGVSSKNSNQLPAGTYYYLVKLNEANKTGGKDYFTGSLLIQR
jgi:gliding motility-associated-like protein